MEGAETNPKQKTPKAAKIRNALIIVSSLVLYDFPHDFLRQAVIAGPRGEVSEIGVGRQEQRMESVLK